MNLLNLHKHKVEIYTFEKNNFIFKENLLSGAKSTKKIYLCLYCIVCRQCKDLYKDFDSKYQINDSNYLNHNDSNGSLFGTKDVIKQFENNKNLVFFEPLEFNHSFVIGTKDEIISKILYKYNSYESENYKLENRINSLESTNKTNEKSLKKVSKDLEREKSENKKAKGDLEKLQKEYNVLLKDLENQKSEKKYLAEKLETVEKEKTGLLKDLETKKLEGQKLEKNLENINKEKNELSIQLKNKESDESKLVKNLEQLKKEKSEISTELKKIKVDNQNIIKNLDKLESDLRKERLEKETTIKNLEVAKKEKNDLSTNSAKIKSEIEKLKINIEKIQKEKNEVSNDLQNKKSENQKIVKNLNDLNVQKNAMNIEIDKLNKIQQNLKEELEASKKNLIIEQKKNNELNKKLDNISNETNENVKKVLLQVENVRKKNETLESKILELQKKETQMNKEKENLVISLKEKEKESVNSSIENQKLENNLNILKKDLQIKENEIKDINNKLNNEKKNINIISEKLKVSEENNKELQNKLDNIYSNNDENAKKFFSQFAKEQENNKNLESKINELKEQEQKNIKKNEELQIQLKNKTDELDNIKKSIPNNIGIQFKCDCKSGEYDIVLNITSFKSLLLDGWEIKYNKKDGKKNYLSKKDEQTIVVGVIGNGDKGKSFILEKLSGYDIPKGFSVKTEGLSIRYATRVDHNIAILDSAGQESPLLNDEKCNINKLNDSKKNITPGNHEFSETPGYDSDSSDETTDKNEEKNNNKKDNKKKLNMEPETEEIEFEKYSRDKLLTEYFLQKFIIFKSNILILVIGKITLTEQKLLSRVKNEVRKLNPNKPIYVIHNLKEFSEESQINEYIENTLKKLYKIEICENIYQQIGQDSNNENKEYFDKYFIEKDKGVCHFIFINEGVPNFKYYNEPVIRFIRQEISSVKEKKIFPVIDDCKQFLVKMSEEIMEETPTIKDLTTIENENSDRIVLKNIKEINLKKFVIDEMGYTLYNDTSDPKYSYYIKKEEKMFYVNIELPGGGKVTPKIEIGASNYFFTYEGIKNGDELVENDKNNESKSLVGVKNLRKNNKFKVVIQIPCSTMQLKIENDEDLDDLGEVSNDGKGVYTWKYKVIIVGDKKEKKKQKTLDL